MKTSNLLALLAIVFFSVSCEDDDPVQSQSELKIEIRSDATFGDYLTTSEGQTLYMFARDLEGFSTCSGNCESLWSPVGVSSILPDIASNDFGLVRRDDGFVQLTFKGWPLYTNRAESSNEISADNTDGEWYVAKPDYTLFIGIRTIDSAERKFLITENGQSVYHKTDDPANESSCLTAACILKYPPLKLDENIFPSILDENMIQSTNRADSLLQSSYKNKPLYIHSLDNRGEASGQGFLGVWFVMEDSFF